MTELNIVHIIIQTTNSINCYHDVQQDNHVASETQNLSNRKQTTFEKNVISSQIACISALFEHLNIQDNKIKIHFFTVE